MNFEKSERLDVNITSIPLFIFGLIVGAIVGINVIATILSAILEGVIAGLLIVLTIYNIFGIPLFIGYQIAISVFEGNRSVIKKIPTHYPRKLIDNFYSPKNQEEVFKPLIKDWEDEIFEALSKDDIWKARIINIRYTYAFISAGWQLSPINDLIEFFRKFMK